MAVALVLVFGISCLLTAVIRYLALRFEVLDHPVSRSAHSQPVPVGGGLAIVVAFYCALVWWYFRSGLPGSVFMALCGGLGIAVIGWLDDIYRLDISWRLPVQVLAAAWAVLWLGPAPIIPFGPWVLEAPWLITPLSIAALVWLLNLYNFMDGIDGLAGAEACYVCGACFLLIIVASQSVAGPVAAVLGAASAGFLVFNWPPARIFMGDVGSGFIGYVLGVLALVSMQDSSLNLWVWLLLLGVFVVDATVTLLRRVARGEKWFEGHSSHAYQQAARRFGSHGQVTLGILAINVVWLTPLAAMAAALPGMGVYLAVLGMLPLLFLTIRFRAGITPVPGMQNK